MGRNGRIAWGVGALALLAVLVATIPWSAGSLASAEAEAKRWAEDKALEVVVGGVEPDIVAKDVVGEDFANLLVRVQAGILADDQASTVRIWRIDGNLLFSTAQRDDVAEVTLRDDPWIERAAGGDVVSVLSDGTTAVPGLRPPEHPSVQTFVPLQPSGASTVMGVVEVDQPYSPIHDRALRLWRLLQVVLGIAFGGVLLGFVLSIRRAFLARRSGREKSTGPVAGARHDLKRERARALAARAWPRAGGTHESDREAPAADVRAAEARIEELDLKVRAAEAEWEQQRAEAKSLRDALVEKEAELVIVREGANSREEVRRERQVLAESHKRAAEAERKSTRAEKRSEDATKRAMDASIRALEIEAQLRSAEETIGTLRSELASRPGQYEEKANAPRPRDAGDRRAAAELKKAQAELMKAQADLSRAQVERDVLADEKTRLEAEVERAEAERSGLEAALEQATLELQAQVAADVDAGRSFGGRVGDTPGRLVRSDASLSDALAKLSELEQTRAALSAELAQLKGVPVEEVVAQVGPVAR